MSEPLPGLLAAVFPARAPRRLFGAGTGCHPGASWDSVDVSLTEGDGSLDRSSVPSSPVAPGLGEGRGVGRTLSLCGGKFRGAGPESLPADAHQGEGTHSALVCLCPLFSSGHFCFTGKGTFVPAVTALCGSPGGPRAVPGCREDPRLPASALAPAPRCPGLLSRLVLCACRKEETVTIYPADVVLFEGILAFYSQEVRDLFQMKLFVDTDADTRLSRRGALARPPWPCWWPVAGPCTPRSEAHTFPEVAPGRPADL